MTREPQATKEVQQVRACINLLAKDDFLPSSLDCVDSCLKENESSRKVRFSTLKFMAL